MKWIENTNLTGYSLLGFKERNACDVVSTVPRQTRSLVRATPYRVSLLGVLYISFNTDSVLFAFPPDKVTPPWDPVSDFPHTLRAQSKG